MSSQYNPPPYHLPMPRFHAPEDLSRNATPKALDVLQHHAAYYNTHKIHELSERALKSPTSGGVKVSVSSPNISQQPGGPPQGPPSQGGGQMPGGGPPPSSGPLNLQPGNVMGGQKGGPDGKPPGEKGTGVGPGSGVGPPGNPADSRSPPPQRHVHTHHHTHVGLGYPMFNAPYGGR